MTEPEKLPALPEHVGNLADDCLSKFVPGYTAEQMHAYALEALRRAEGDGYLGEATRRLADAVRSSNGSTVTITKADACAIGSALSMYAQAATPSATRAEGRNDWCDDNKYNALDATLAAEPSVAPSVDDRFEEFRDKLAALATPTAQRVAAGECTLGVGDGSGRLFVHGDYESIKAAQALIDRAAAPPRGGAIELVAALEAEVYCIREDACTDDARLAQQLRQTADLIDKALPILRATHPAAQADARDTARLDFITAHRIEVGPECEGQWWAEIYGHEGVAITAYVAATPREAIDKAMSALAAPVAVGGAS